jgi:DNA-binding transcriptional regulator LsrR (DeoR family)
MSGNRPDDPKSEYIRVAYYYYKAKLTQEEISRKMNMSRQRVNRILGRCESLGIVRIEIVGYDSLYLDLEMELERKYGLEAVRVVGSDLSNDIYGDLGIAAGKYLAGIVENGAVIGFSRGRATAALVDNMPPLKKEGLEITQLVGGWNGQQNAIDVDDIVSRFARKLNASVNKLYAPVIVKSPEIRRSIMEEPYFRSAYEKIRSCSIAAVGIGNLENLSFFPDRPEAATPVSGNAVKGQGDRSGAAPGAVGEICARFFDIQGKRVHTAFDDRIIAIDTDDFLRIPVRIGIAGTPAKLNAIIGAQIGRAHV